MKSIISLILLLSCLQVHCHHEPGHHDDQHDHDKHHHPSLEHGNETLGCHKIAGSNADFAFSLYKLIASDVPARNIFYSPVSISTAFALLTLGAKSETLDQLHKGLAFNLSETEEKEIHEGFHHLLLMLNRPNNKAQVNIGNALFIDAALKILPKFLEDVNSLYEAEGFSINFGDPTAAEKQINDYVKNKTHGKIADAVGGLDPRAVMVIVNYIFFKAYWENPFSTALIREEDFFVDANTTVKVNLMYREGYYKVLHDNDLSCWVVEVPYKGDAVALFILPDEGKLKQVEDALGKRTLSKWKTSLMQQKIYLYIPKFSMSTSYDIKDLLQKLGVSYVFEDSADLSGITGERNLKVSKAIHKAVVNVHESGTEAAAVTTMQITPMSLPIPPPPKIKLNRPFMMMIIEKTTKSNLFILKMVDPTQE